MLTMFDNCAIIVLRLSKKGVHLVSRNVTIENIKSGIGRHVGKSVIIMANKGRKKIVTKRGVIEGIYPSVFMVSFQGEGDITTRVTYSYTDVLTENVQIKLTRD